jgi:hypothetical protein
MNPRLGLILLLIAFAFPVHAAINSYADLQSKFRDPALLDAEIHAKARSSLGTHHWLIIVTGAGTDYYWAETSDGHVIRSGRGRRYSPPPSAIILTDRQTIDNILSSSDRFAATTAALKSGRLQITYVNGGIAARIGLGAATLFTPTPPAGTKSVGQVCQHGGECITGNCVGAGMGPPWTYLCSCDSFRYATSGPQCQSPVVIPQGGNQAGAVCKHGGECASGSCVGDGMGPPWTYRCSCQSARYSTSGPLCK